LRFLHFGRRGSDGTGAAPIVGLAFGKDGARFYRCVFRQPDQGGGVVDSASGWPKRRRRRPPRQTNGIEGALKKIAGIPTRSRLRDFRQASLRVVNRALANRSGAHGDGRAVVKADCVAR